MLNIFPIQFLAPFAYMILRVCIGIIMIRFGFNQIRNRRHDTISTVRTYPNSVSIHICFGIFQIIAGTLLFLGLYTQIAALSTIFLSFLSIYVPQLRNGGDSSRLAFILIITISLSLCITGGGALGFDLPI